LLPEKFSIHSKKLGRPQLLSDEKLLNRRQRLVEVLEFRWAEFAWELQRAKSISALRLALHPIRDFTAFFEVFTYEPTRDTTRQELRALKGKRGGERVRVGLAIQQEREEKERLDRAEGALRDAGSDDNLERLCGQRKRRYAMAQEQAAGLTARIEEIDENIRRQEAFLAQSEFLQFLRSKRYAFNPLNIANAIAGLPYIAWRQSMTRCQRHKTVHPYGHNMQMFRQVSVALANPPRTAELAVEQMRTHLQKVNSKRNPFIAPLRNDFYYLRVATEAAYKARPPKAALSYRVFAEFLRRAASRSPFDVVMEEEERL
jgi:hypothetical protein